MKPSAKRRRSKAQIKEEKKQEEKRKNETQAKMLSWNDLETELDKYVEKNKMLENVHLQVSQMYEDGQIKQRVDGSFEAVVDPVEREQIRSKMKPNPQQQHAQMSQQESMSNIRQSEVDEILDVDLGIE